MTFNEFLKTHKVNGYALCDVQGPHYLSDQEIQLLADAWNAAIEAACTKLVRGTNLYNISGDHISGQIIESIEQLKSS